MGVAANVDLDRDGVDDLVVGAPGHDLGNGIAYAFLNPMASAGTASDTADHSVVGMYEERFGSEALGLGDSNGDGFEEVAIVSSSFSILDDGAVYVPEGYEFLSLVDTHPGGWPDNLHGLDGTGMDMSVGDFDGDGLTDLLIGGSNTAWLENGPIPNGTDLTVGATHQYRGVAGEEPGIGVALGDLDGDGKDEVLYGSGMRGSDGEISIFRGCFH